MFFFPLYIPCRSCGLDSGSAFYCGEPYECSGGGAGPPDYADSDSECRQVRLLDSHQTALGSVFSRGGQKNIPNKLKKYAK